MDSLIADYQGDLSAAEATYFEAVGDQVAGNMVKPSHIGGIIPDDINKVVERVKVNHPSVRAAWLEVRATKNDYQAEESALLPEFGGELSLFKSNKKDVIGGEVADARAIVRMNWSFDMGGRQFSSIERKKALHARAKAKVAELQRSVERDILSAYANYRTLVTKTALAKDRVSLNERLLANYKVQFEGARVNLLVLMRAEGQLYKARLELLEDDYKLMIAEYAVLEKMGKLKNFILGDEVKTPDNGALTKPDSIKKAKLADAD